MQPKQPSQDPQRQTYHSRQPLSPQQRAAQRRRQRAQRMRNRLLGMLLLLGALSLFAWGITEMLTRDPLHGVSQSAATQSPAPTQTPVATVVPTQTPPAQTAAPQATAVPVAETEGENAWMLRLVNHTHPLPDDFTVELGTLPNGLQFDARAIDQLEKMLDDGNASGLQLMVCSAYRSIARQDQLFEQMKQQYIAQGMTEQEAYDKTSTIRTPHACSEHSSGLAADIVAVNYQTLDDGFGDTPEAKWLAAHAVEYGFILRYPKDKEDITGIIWEPWHFRYVGVENAQKIKDSGLCLEEYLGEA